MCGVQLIACGLYLILVSFYVFFIFSQELFDVACPEGMEPGQLLFVTTPRGKEIELYVPEGVVAGDLIAVAWPPPAAVEEEEEGEEDEVVEPDTGEEEVGADPQGPPGPPPAEGSVSNSVLSEDALAFLMDCDDDDTSSDSGGSANSA